MDRLKKNEYQRNWRKTEKGKAYIKEYQKKYRKRNKNKIRKYYLDYYYKHKEKINKKNREYYFKNKRNIDRKQRITKCIKILKEHHEKLKDDPEHLTTEFLSNLIGCNCERNKTGKET